MSRDVLLEAVLAVAATVFLALVVGAVSSGRAPRPGRGAVVRGLVYVALVAPSALAVGMTLPVLLGLAALLCLPLVAARAATRPAFRPGDAGPAAALARAVVATGLVTVVLCGAGQSVALLGRVDPRTTVVLIAASAAGVALVGRLVGSARVGLWAALLLLPTVALVLAAGIALGSPGDLVDPAVTVPGPSAVQWLAWALVLPALGWADPALNRAVAGASRPQVLRIAAILLAYVLVAGLGLLLLLGGAVIGPSMQLFALPANLGVIPGPVFAVLLGVSFAAVAVVAALLAAAHAGISAAGTVPGSSGPVPVLVMAILGVVGALVTGAPQAVTVVAALVAAALVGCEVVRRPSPRPAPPGLVAGVAAAAVASVALGLAGQLTFGGPVVVALGTVAAVAAAAQARSGQRARVPA
jgi:hypothetical protein